MIWRCEICDALVKDVDGIVREFQTHFIICIGKVDSQVGRSVHSTDQAWNVNLFDNESKLEVWGPREPPFNAYILKRESNGARMAPQSYDNFIQLFTKICRAFGIIPRPTSFK